MIHSEETFGPVAPVIVFDDEADILAKANDTAYGLAAYIYTKDISRAWRTAEGLRFGIIGINDINPTSAAAPFGGVDESGMDARAATSASTSTSTPNSSAGRSDERHPLGRGNVAR